MNKDVFLSAIVPVYNVKPYLKECLDSLLSQTKKFDEIIIVNDGSTDGSDNICMEYCEKNDNIILINQDNHGLSAARNAGLKNAQGKYVVFVDSDDYVDADMNICLYNLLKDEELDVLYYSADIFDETQEYHDSECYIRGVRLNGYTMSGTEFFEKSFPDNYIVSACLAAYKKSFLDFHNIVFPYGLYYEDNVFFIQTILYARKVQCIPEHLYIRRFRNGSITESNKTHKKCLDFIEIHRLISEHLYSYEHKSNYKYIYKRYLSICAVLILDYVKEYRNEDGIRNKIGELIDIYTQYWGELFVENLNWNDIYSLITATYYLQRDTEVYNRITRTIHKGIYAKLNWLPLNHEGRKIGIYGIGQHTEKLIQMYEQYVGEICCDLYFIETQRNKEEHMGKQVINCDEIPQNTDSIVVSSLLHGQGMLSEMQKRNIRQDKIILLYEDDDVIDLVTIANLMGI